MFGRKKRKAKREAKKLPVFEYLVKNYDSEKKYQKEANKLAKKGWQVDNVEAKAFNRGSGFLKVQRETLVVTYKRQKS
jgi:hypothetical protein